MSVSAGVTRRAHWLLVLAAGCAPEHHPATSLNDNGASPDDTCSVAKHVEVPLDLFGTLSDPPSLVPFGARFAIVASEAVTLAKTASVALVSWHGVDAQDEFELTGLCPDDVCRNVHGVGALSSAAGEPEFLLAEQGSAVSMPAYPLRVLAWDTDGSEPAIAPLFESRVTAITTRSDLKSSRDANRALFALGNIDMPALPALAIAAGAALVAPTTSMTLPALPWDCLAVVPTETAGALSVVSRPDSGTEVVWSLRELDADANIVFEASVSVPVGVALGYGDCPTVVESPAGFHAQWTNTNAASIVATIARSAEPTTAPELLSFETSPGSLAAVLHEQFLFLAELADQQVGFVRLDHDGAAGGPNLVLPPLPAATDAQRRATPQVLRVDGSSVDVSYELEAARVFERLDCP